MTIYSRIALKVIDLINASRPGNVPEPKRNHMRQLDESQLPILNVRMGQSGPLIDAATAHRIQMIGPTSLQAAICHVDIFVKVENDSQRPEDLIDPILAWVVKSCAGRQETSEIADVDRTFIQIDPGPRIVPDAEQVDFPYGNTRVDLVVLYQTRANDPETWA